MEIKKIRADERSVVFYLQDSMDLFSFSQFKNLESPRIIFDLQYLYNARDEEIYSLIDLANHCSTHNKQVELRCATKETVQFLRKYKLEKYIYIERVIEEIDISGATQIGSGLCGQVYRISDDEILKLYKEGLDYEMISKEKKYSREALICGVPTAISRDIVSVGPRFGIIFEMEKGDTLVNVIRNDLTHIDKYAKMFAELAKQVHKIPAPLGKFPDRLDEQVVLFRRNKFLSKEENAKVEKIIKTMPHANTCIHGDFHTGNVMIVNGELEFIDMGDFAKAHPYEDIAQAYLMFTPGLTQEDCALQVTKLEPKYRKQFIDVFMDEYFNHPTKEEYEAIFKEVKKFFLMREFFFIENFEMTREFNEKIAHQLIKEIEL